MSTLGELRVPFVCLFGEMSTRVGSAGDPRRAERHAESRVLTERRVALRSASVNAEELREARLTVTVDTAFHEWEAPSPLQSRSALLDADVRKFKFVMYTLKLENPRTLDTALNRARLECSVHTLLVSELI